MASELLVLMHRRLEELRRQDRELVEQIMAIAGAIRECEFWIAHLLKQDAGLETGSTPASEAETHG